MVRTLSFVYLEATKRGNQKEKKNKEEEEEEGGEMKA